MPKQLPFSKSTRTRLKGKALKDLYLQVVNRDNGQCKICKGQGTEAHHIRYGSYKEDCLENLVLLCANDHAKVHAHQIAIEPYLSQQQKIYIETKREQSEIREAL